MPISRSKRVTLESNPLFTFSYDITNLGEGCDMYRLHLDFDIWSKKALKAFTVAYQKHRPKLPNVLFCQPAADSPLFEKFVSRFGFKFISDCWCEDGVNRRIFVNYRR